MNNLNFTYHISEIDAVAKSIINNLKSKIVLFNGDMGAGKTTLIKAISRALGSSDDINSPTFSIVNEYKVKKDKIFHFDFYRIEAIEEAYNIGIEDYLYSDHWIFIEWAERVKELIPENSDSIYITIQDTNNRALKLTTNTINLTNKMLENN